jgi:hypothetical protein
MPVTVPRSLADQLRSWPDERLGALLDARPDLAAPAPQDSSQLAGRAGTRASVLRALDLLNRLELTVLDALVALGSRAPAEAVVAAVHAPPERAEAALAHLHDLALVWGPAEDLRVVSAVPEALGTTVAELGPPVETLLGGAGPDRVSRLLGDLGETSSGDRATDAARVAALLRDPATVDRLLAECAPAGRAMLTHLDRTGADGASDQAAHPVVAAEARTPVEQLLARGLLMPRDRRHVVVPREVGMALRAGRTTHEPVGEPPALVTSARQARLVDQAAAGAAMELGHRVELLLDHWGAEPPPVLRQGGLAVRDLKALAGLLHGDERLAALVVETAAAAGLLAQGPTTELDAAWLPTDAFDSWRSLDLAHRWSRLAGAWLHGDRLTGLVGGRLQGRTVNALAADLERPWLAETRQAALREVAALPDGEVLATGTGIASLVARLRWLQPRRPATRADAVAWAVEEAAVVGVLGLGGIAHHGRELLDDGPDAAATRLAPLLPSPVDHVLLQADLTAVAPGPLEERLARDLATVAQVESRGGATVYRFTESSVRHAFDLGWSAGEVRELVTGAARTAVPQALDYLIDDVARTFGTVRVGIAESFLRSDDEAALAALVHDPLAAGLGLRRLAPTVVVSSTPLDVLLPRLRELGVAPVVEGPDGVVRVARKDAHRARAPKGRDGGARAAESAARRAARTAATITAVRAGDRAATGRPTAPPAARQTPASALALLREAAEAGTTVRIGYVDGDGSVHDRVVDPERIEGGWLRAFDHRSEEVRSYAVHRVSSVQPL